MKIEIMLNADGAIFNGDKNEAHDEVLQILQRAVEDVANDWNDDIHTVRQLYDINGNIVGNVQVWEQSAIEKEMKRLKDEIEILLEEIRRDKAELRSRGIEC